MYYKVYICLVSLTILFCLSCNKQNKESAGLFDECSVIATKTVTDSGDTVVTCDVASVKESMIIPLSKLIDSLEIIRLENIDTAMIKPVVVDITDNHIGTNSYSAYKLFTRDGKYLTDFESQRQDFDKYPFAYDSQIDEGNHSVYILPWTSKDMLVYDLDGTFVKSIPLSYLVHKGVFNLDIKQQRISIVQMPFGEGDEPLAWSQDFEGRIRHESKQRYLDLWPDYSNEIPTQKIDKNGRFIDFYLYACVPRADTLYYYDAMANKCIPRFTAKFPNDNVLRHIYYEFSNYYMVDIINSSPYTWIVDKHIIINKSTLKGGKYKIIIDQLGGIPLEVEGVNCSRSDYFIYCIEPRKLKAMIGEQLSYKERMTSEDISKLMELTNSISENDNTYILLGKWK